MRRRGTAALVATALLIAFASTDEDKTVAMEIPPRVRGSWRTSQSQTLMLGEGSRMASLSSLHAKGTPDEKKALDALLVKANHTWNRLHQASRTAAARTVRVSRPHKGKAKAKAHGPWTSAVVGGDSAAQITTILRGMVNVAARTQGATSSCRAFNESGLCAGSFDGLVSELSQMGDQAATRTDHNDRGLYTFFYSPSDRPGWVKVEFRQVFLLKYMAIYTRPCPCERWQTVTLHYGSAKTPHSRKVKLMHEADHSLYQINMSTSWVKLVPGVCVPGVCRTKKLRPGAIELEFYTPSTASVKPTCRWNPSLLSTDARCSDAWDNYVITKKENGRPHRPQVQLEYFNASNVKAYRQLLTNKRVSVGSTAIHTNEKCIMAFKLRRPTVGGSYYGDCRSDVQGTRCENNGFKHKPECRTCVVAKWTSCCGKKCKVKKKCFLVGLDSLPAHHSARLRARLAACMTSRCKHQCIMG